jgi:DNA-binding transcriptional LysR family regulator
MRYTLRQLEVFLAVARTGNVSRAGEALHLSQSAVSGALGELERQFDVLLFDRIGKRLRLSELGAALRPRAEAVLDAARELEAAFAGHSGAGPLRVGATLTIGNYLVVPLMARFMRDEPAADITLQIANTEEIARRVLNFEIDVGLVEGELAHPGLTVTPFLDDELVVFAGPGHPLARRRRLTDADLLEAAWIVREKGSGTRQAFERAMHGLLPRLHIALELQQTEVIQRAVESGLGLGCLSRLVIADAVRQGRLRPLSVPGRDFRRQFFFVLQRRKHRSATLERWLALCRAAGAASPATEGGGQGRGDAAGDGGRRRRSPRARRRGD